MCGIGGILRVTPPGDAAAALSRPLNQAIPEAWLNILDESIKHRGPDGQGRYRDRAVRADGSVVDVALVHRRLSIIDHACGAQPMVWPPLPEGGGRGVGGERATDPGAPSFGTPSVSAGAAVALPSPLLFHGRPNDPVVYSALPGAAQADRVAVVFNGCIYNHRELRKELQAAGHEFVTDHSDTEVLVHGWREWGVGLFERLDGMFAIIIWSREDGTVCVARNGSGEKTVYYTDEIGPSFGFAFASTAGALMKFVNVARDQAVEIDQRLTASWIQFGFGGGTPTWDVQEVASGQATVFGSGSRFGDGRDTSHCISTHAPMYGRQPDHFGVEAVESLLTAGVERCLEADVPIGCFLSGGLDSPMIAALAQRALKQGGASLRTFTVRSPDPALDESAAAEHVAFHLGTTHTTLDARMTPVDDLLRLIPQMGVPLGDSSLLPTHWVSRATREHATVALSGDGGDELFCGYQRHRALRWLRDHGGLLRRLPVRAAARGSPRGVSAKLARLVAAARGDGYPDLVAIFQLDARKALLPSVDPLAIDPQPLGGRWFDYSIYLPNDLLRKVDSASMSVGLEVRAPMLYAPLAAACMATDEETLMPNGQRKGFLRQVARKYLPAEIVDRPKMGFAIPIGEWFRSDYGGMRTLLYDRLNSREPFGPDSLGINSMINMNFVRQMLKEHDDAGAKSLWPWKGRDHSQRLYMLLVLSIWADWLGGVQSGTSAKQQSSK